MDGRKDEAYSLPGHIHCHHEQLMLLCVEVSNATVQDREVEQNPYGTLLRTFRPVT